MIIKPKIGSGKCCFRGNKTQNFRSFRGLCPLNPIQGSALDSLGAYSTPRPPSCFLLACGRATTKLLPTGLKVARSILIQVYQHYCVPHSSHNHLGIITMIRTGDVGKINLEVEARSSNQLDALSFSTRQTIKTCYSV